MKAREILRFQILLVVITKLFLRLKLIRAFALSLRRDDLSWRIFLIMKNALKSCEKLNQKKNKSTELRLIDIFKQNGITGWKRNYPVKGHPDFVFLKKKKLQYS